MVELQRKRWQALMALVLWVGQAFYVLFPFDLLPDFIPIIGWMDDLVALAGLALTTLWMLRTLHEFGLDTLLGADEPAVIDAEPYHPIPVDVLRAL